MPLLQVPDNGVAVRMYRQGHGDCFLLALPRQGGGDPYYVLIDCGLKPGSQNFLDHKKPIGDIVEHIVESTGGHLDLVILTHEHQDHLNGIWKENDPPFGPFEIEEAWVAWTEDPDNEVANTLRKRHKDTLLGLVAARREMALAVGEDDPAVLGLDALLGMEIGGVEERPSMAALLAAAADPTKSENKQGLKLVKDKAAKNRGYFYLYPGIEPIPLEGSAGIRAYVLGPPENADMIADEDPQGAEGFPQENGFSFAAAAHTAAVEGGADMPGRRADRAAPFRRQYSVPAEDALGGDEPFFTQCYGSGEQGQDHTNRAEVADNAPWRRIDNEWLFSAEDRALKLNTGINNTSLVLAFELPKSKKILLFAGDAQRGNWISWDDQTWQDGTKSVTARDILARTVLYKVGHHGSHNATLAGAASDDYPNLSWMAQGAHAAEFTAMITAVNEWALLQKPFPWVHPLPSIKEALERKARGRVFQTDTNKPAKPSSVSKAEWDKFLARATFEDIYFDYVIVDE